MEIVIRHIKSEEENEVRSLGRKAFGGFESLFIPKSKKALVALADGKIVAGVMIKILKGSAENKIGYIDYAFVDKAYHNHGIGTIFLIYRIVAIYPLSSFGGERLFVWNKVLYGILAILSLVVLFI